MFDKLRVLIADDNGKDAASMAQHLWMKGYVVLVAHSVATAKRLCENTRFDLLICRLDLIDGSGGEVLDAVRTTGRLTVAIALTEELDPNEHSKQLGFAAQLAKPVQSDELHRTIQLVMQAPGSQ